MEAPPAPASDEYAAAFVMDLNEAILGCATRAVSLLDEPQAIPLLYPGVKRELCYRLPAGHMALSCPHGRRCGAKLASGRSDPRIAGQFRQAGARP
ncbi:AraC family transcriptional regulator N-terminal domain-containing protein [Bradyrhizobium frederickii]|uniref:AraC family transcriptional regulator N-terminal domain-containing protein n=1 Tax=Bradyrhizobium frederickii TaxID=2560054 RepID=UPI003D312C90